MLIKSKRNLLILFIVVLFAASIAIAGCDSDSSDTVTIAGSTTVQPVAEALAEAYKDVNPDVTVTISGGGSSTGVKSADNGTVDIGAASRELKDSEPDLVEHVLARDGIAIVTHPSNTVAGLTTEQVRNIFAGDITNWSEVDGPDHSITVISREEGSGTRGAFEEMVMDEELITADALLFPSNGNVKTSVSTTEWSIGYISFGYLDSDVKSLAVDGIEGTIANAKNGTYPIVRPLLLLTKEEPEGAVKDFIDFCLSADGQAIVEDEGYISAS